MSLEAQIDTDLKTAMKARKTEKVTTLRMIKAAIDNLKIQKKTENLSEEDVLGIVQKQAKQRKESIESFEGAGRAELAEKEKLELSFLEAYLPAQLSDEELENLAKTAIEESGASSKADTGKVMSALMPKVKGKADGKRVNQAVMKLLG